MSELSSLSVTFVIFGAFGSTGVCRCCSSDGIRESDSALSILIVLGSSGGWRGSAWSVYNSVVAGLGGGQLDRVFHKLLGLKRKFLSLVRLKRRLVGLMKGLLRQVGGVSSSMESLVLA